MRVEFSWYGRRLCERLDCVLGAAAFMYLLAFPRMLGRADESVVLYGAKRLLQGQVLYKDFFEFITPASFYFFAGLFSLTGPSLLAARVAMAAANGFSCVLLFRLVRRAAGVAEAAVAVAVFAVVCLPVWPYASPHWLSTVLCLATANVVLSERWERAGAATLALTGSLVGLTFCTQQHRGVFLAVWTVAAIAILTRLTPAGERWRRGKRQLSWVGASAAIVAAAILGYSAWRASVQSLLDGILFFVLRNYYPFVHGPTLSGNMAWSGVAFLAEEHVPYTWMWLLRGLPIILAIEAIALSWTLRRQRGRSEAERGCCLLLALLMTLAIGYLPDYIHVAFIAPFSLIVMARLAYAIRTLPLWRLNALKPLPAVACAVVLLATARKGWANRQYAWAQAPEHFDSAVGTLYGNKDDRELLENVQSALKLNGPRPWTLLSYPADAWLYLAVPADDPIPFAVMVHGYNSPEQFAAASAALEARPPRCLVVNIGVSGNDSLLRSQIGRYQRLARVGWYDIYGRTDF